VIKTINVSKVYNNGPKQLEVLKGINLEINKGEFVAVVGPSGAGKSTLLHILGALDTPTTGSVAFNGIDLYESGDQSRADMRNKEIGFVFQFYHLMPEFNVLENVLMPALISRAKHASDKAKSLLMSLGLGGRMTHKPNQLSGGEQQRVAIARALINSPRLLLCDEPTGNLDSKTGRDVMDALMALNKKESLTCVMVTHEEALARDADRALHMTDGRIL